MQNSNNKHASANFTWLYSPDVDIHFLPQVIPMPVLYGVFMFMGVAALKGMQVN
jgi:hypothetical protein